MSGPAGMTYGEQLIHNATHNPGLLNPNKSNICYLVVFHFCKHLYWFFYNYS